MCRSLTRLSVLLHAYASSCAYSGSAPDACAHACAHPSAYARAHSSAYSGAYAGPDAWAYSCPDPRPHSRTYASPHAGASEWCLLCAYLRKVLGRHLVKWNPALCGQHTCQRMHKLLPGLQLHRQSDLCHHDYQLLL